MFSCFRPLKQKGRLKTNFVCSSKSLRKKHQGNYYEKLKNGFMNFQQNLTSYRASYYGRRIRNCAKQSH